MSKLGKGIGDDGSGLLPGDHYDANGNLVDADGNIIFWNGDVYTIPNDPSTNAPSETTLQKVVDDIEKGLVTAQEAYIAYQTATRNPNAPNPFRNLVAQNTMSSLLLPAVLVGGVVLLASNKKSKSNISGMKNMKHLVDFSGANFKKEALPTVEDIAVITGSIIASRKFIDFNKLPATMTSSTFAQGLIKHQGAAKGLLGWALACVAKEPILRNVGIGIAIDGAIQEARVFFANADGTNAIPAINGITTDKNASNTVIGYMRDNTGKVIRGVMTDERGNIMTAQRASSSVIGGAAKGNQQGTIASGSYGY